MNKSRQMGWTLGLVLVLVACGGRVDDPVEQGGDGGADPQGQGGDGGSSSGSGDNGGKTGGSAAGPSCAATPPHPDYPNCYSISYPPCLAPGTPELADKLGGLSVSKGPWVGASSNCRMLCCYAP